MGLPRTCDAARPIRTLPSAETKMYSLHQKSDWHQEKWDNQSNESGLWFENTVIPACAVSDEGIGKATPAIGTNEAPDTRGYIDEATDSCVHAIWRKLKY